MRLHVRRANGPGSPVTSGQVQLPAAADAEAVSTSHGPFTSRCSSTDTCVGPFSAANSTVNGWPRTAMAPFAGLVTMIVGPRGAIVIFPVAVCGGSPQRSPCSDHVNTISPSSVGANVTLTVACPVSPLLRKAPLSPSQKTVAPSPVALVDAIGLLPPVIAVDELTVTPGGASNDKSRIHSSPAVTASTVTSRITDAPAS